MASFRSNNLDLVELARNDLSSFWGALNLAGNPALVRDALLEFFPELIAAYGDAAALLAADFYDELRDVPPSSARYRAVLAAPPAAEQAEGAARWAVGPLFADEPKPAQALAALAGATQRLVLQSGRETVFRSASTDPVPTGFARVPAGATCAFCTMLASRGFVYATAAAAGESNSWHDDCNCTILPGRSIDDLPEGYDLSRYERAYAAGVGID